MHVRPPQRQSKQDSIYCQPALIVKLHISPTMQTEISLSPGSNIDYIIHDCIVKYKLKKQAHPFLKQQIMKFVSRSQSAQKCKNQSFQHYQQQDSAKKCPLVKKQMIIKDLKVGDIDRNKVSIQRTPKNSQYLSNKKQQIFKTAKFVSQSQSNPKIYLKKKRGSEKQNSQESSFCNTSSILEQKGSKNNSIVSGPLIAKKSQQIKRNNRQNGLINKNLGQLEKEISAFLERSAPLEQKRQKERKFKTIQSQILDSSLKMKQFSLKDLQNEMNEQVEDLKYEKRVKSLNCQLSNLFHSIIRYNPPKINKIDPRYACFEDLQQKVIQSLHEFLIQLKDDELNSLDFENFKNLLVKYRGDILLSTLK